MPTITEAQLRQMVANQITEWLGATRGSALHKKIIDSYNSFPEVANTKGSYKMTYTDAWCACTVSVVVQILGIYKYTAYDVSCSSWVNKAKNLGIWIENENRVPKIGEFVLFRWDDKTSYASYDNKDTPNHIGIVTDLNGTVSFISTEGNMSSASKVGTRNNRVNGRYLRGFVSPDSAAIATLINEGKLPFPAIRPDCGYNNGYLTTAEVK